MLEFFLRVSRVVTLYAGCLAFVVCVVFWSIHVDVLFAGTLASRTAVVVNSLAFNEVFAVVVEMVIVAVGLSGVLLVFFEYFVG